MCNVCNRGVRYNESVITLAPQIVIVQLMRFRWEDGRASKVLDNVYVEDVIDLTPLCADQTSKSLYHLISVVVHRGNSVQSGHYVTYVNDRINQRKILYDDHEVDQVTDQEFQQSVDEGAYILIYEKCHDLTKYTDEHATDGDSATPSGSSTQHQNNDNRNNAPLNSKHFSVTPNEKVFVENVWGYIDESIVHKDALKLKTNNETITFCHLAILNFHIPNTLFQTLQTTGTEYVRGWTSNFFVDFYLQQLADSNEVTSTIGALLCSETLAIVDRKESVSTYRSVKRKCIHNNRWCDLILCPLLKSNHFVLYVIDQNKQCILSYDPLRPSLFTSMPKHAKAFADFFSSGLSLVHWDKLPNIIQPGGKVAITNSTSVSQNDFSACGLYCCVFAEEVALGKRKVRHIDTSEELRLYLTMNVIRRAHILDVGLKQLFGQSFHN